MPYKDPEKRREYCRKWMAARRAAYLRDESCVVCGSKERLEVDHIDRTKKIDHKVWSWSEPRRMAELAKCQILCHECHLLKTIEERMPEHGSNSMYTGYGCRCQLCRDAHAEVNRKYRIPVGN